MRWILFFLTAALFAKDPCCPPDASCSCKPYRGVEGVLFPAVSCVPGPCSPCGLFWIADVSLLAWQAREEGLEFALKNNPLPIASQINVNGKLVGIDFSWEPAVKVNIGARFANRSWDAQLRWTYFHTHSSRTLHASAQVSSAGLIPLWAFPNADLATQFLYGTARGSLKINFNSIDIEMGYHPFLSPALSLRFLAGLKVAMISQDFSVRYSDGFNDGVSQLLSASADLTNQSIGTGPRIGFDSKWHLGRGFSLLGLIAGSLPLWHYRMSRNDADRGIDAGAEESVDAIFRERFWTFRSVLETSIGLSWDTCFGAQRQYPFGASASYEFQYFPEQNMMLMLVDPGLLNQVFTPRGDFVLHGATLTFHFGF